MKEAGKKEGEKEKEKKRGKKRKERRKRKIRAGVYKTVYPKGNCYRLLFTGERQLFYHIPHSPKPEAPSKGMLTHRPTWGQCLRTAWAWPRMRSK